MKKFLVICLISIFVLALPISASALNDVYLTTNYANLIYDLQNGCYIDLGTWQPIDMSFVPDDIEHIGYYNFDSVSDAPQSPDSAPEVLGDVVCTLDGVPYYSIVDAFDSLSELTGSREIVLYSDGYSGNCSLIVPSGVHLNLLLNDYSVIGESNYALLSDGDLAIIGAGSIRNSLGGGIYNRGIGTVTIYNCVSFDVEGYAFVNNQDGTIFINDDTNIVSLMDPYSIQLSSGAGSIIDNTLADEELEAPEDSELGPMLLSAPAPESGPDLSGSDSDMDAMIEASESFLSRFVDLILSPPYIYIVGFILLCSIVIIIKCKFF